MSYQLISSISLILFLTIVAIYDYKGLFIPNRLLILGSFVGLLLLYFNEDHQLLLAILSSCTVGGLALIIAYLTEGGLGMGDVKLLFSLGLYMRLWSLLNMLFIATFLSGIVALVLLIVGKVSKKTALPFAPFILLGTILLLVTGSL